MWFIFYIIVDLFEFKCFTRIKILRIQVRFIGSSKAIKETMRLK